MGCKRFRPMPQLADTPAMTLAILSPRVLRIQRDTSAAPLSQQLLCLALSLGSALVAGFNHHPEPRIVSGIVAVLSLGVACWLGRQAPRWWRTWEIDANTGTASLTIHEPHPHHQTGNLGVPWRVAFQREYTPSGVPEMWSVLVMGSQGHIRMTGFCEGNASLAAQQISLALALPCAGKRQKVGCPWGPSDELMAG